MAEKTIKKSELDENPEVVKELEAKAQAKGYLSREQQLRRQDELQAEAERIASQMQSGTIDASKLEIANEIASQTQLLNVSNADPAFVYAWVSKNRHGQHIQALRNMGWITVQGEDPEALELKGGAGTGTPDTTRQLGDVILMKIPHERYVVLRSMEIAHTRQQQKASTSALLELGDKYKKSGIIVRPYRMEDPDGDLSGPPITSKRFTSKSGAMNMVDKALRDGSVPGMEITRG